MSNRHTILRLSFAAILAIIGLSISMLTYAASGDTVVNGATGTVTIEQKNAFDGTISTWLLIKPNHEELQGQGDSTLLHSIPVGTYTLFVKTPDGMTSSIRTYHDREQLQHLERPQITFKLTEGEHLTIVIHHSLTHTGIVSVQSDPAGLSFTLDGPNGFSTSGETPASFDGYPVGLYRVQFKTLEGCKELPPKSAQLEDNGRASFSVTLSCAAADKLRNRQKQDKSNDEQLWISVNGQDVKLRDVPTNSWFASYIYNAAKRGILAGYRDDSGNYSGLFGPENSVTIAELAKMAHRMASISEANFVDVNPENPLALGQWFSPFIASAENRGWAIYNDATVDPNRPVTRAEVVMTFLQVLDVPLTWQKGNVFTDVTARTKYAAAIETAANAGVIEGRKDEDGKPLNLFDPEGPINRAEIAKILDSAFKVYREK